MDAPNKTRLESVVAEVTPRVRARHPGWTISRLRDLMNKQTRIRVSGWLMMDAEHPDQIGKTRGSIWEIHPILEIEVETSFGWQPLDRATSAAPPASPVPTRADGPPPIVETPEPGVSTATPKPYGVGDSSTTVKITRVFYDGVKTNEPDEYVEIVNDGPDPVRLDDWTLRDAQNTELRALCGGRDEFAASLGLPGGQLDAILAGQAPITAEIAWELERLLEDVSARFWMGLQADYDLAVARLRRASA